MRTLRDQALDISRFDLVGKATIYSFLSISLVMIVIGVLTNNRGKCSYALWHNLAFLSLIHWIPLINIDDYSEFESFFEEISVIFRPYRLSSICTDEPIDVRLYQIMNIYSNGFINNAKEILIIYFFVLFCCLIVIITSRYSKSEFIQSLNKKVRYSVIIRLHLILYLDFMTFGMINVYFYSGKNTCSSVNLGLSLFFLLMGGCWIMAIPVLIKMKMTNDIESHHDIVFQSISTIVNEFKPSFQTTKYQYYTIFLLYRFSLAFCLIILPNSPSVQLFIIAVFQAIICKVYIVFYICLATPFVHKRDSVTVFISEFLCLLLVIFIGIRSLNSISENTKYYTSAFCVFIIWITEFVIVTRFVLSIVMHKKSSLEIDQNETSSAVVVPINILKPEILVKERNLLKDNIENSKDLDDNIQSFYPMDPYKFIKDSQRNEKIGLKADNKELNSDKSSVRIEKKIDSKIISKLDLNRITTNSNNGINSVVRTRFGSLMGMDSLTSKNSKISNRVRNNTFMEGLNTEEYLNKTNNSNLKS